MNKPDPRLRRASALPWQEVSLDVLREKYAKGAERDLDGAEAVRAVRQRVARALAAVEADPAAHEAAFLKALEDGFIPGGRINSAAGSGIRDVTLINCFVQPVGDSVSETVDGKPGIYIALREAAETMRRGGGVGYDFSAIRPRGARVQRHRQRGVGADQLHARLRPVLRHGGVGRRAARGADGRAALRPPGRHGVRRRQAAGGAAQQLQHLGRRHRRADAGGGGATATFELTHKAEPGAAQMAGGAHRRDGRALGLCDDPGARALVGDHAQHLRGGGARGAVPRPDQRREQPPLLRADRGDQSLRRDPDPGPWLLLPRVDQPDALRDAIPSRRRPGFDLARFEATVAVAVRMLDNVLTATVWPLPEQAREAATKRRIGLGFTGLGDALILLGLRYDSAEARELAADLTRRDARRGLSGERGAGAGEGGVSALRRGDVPRLGHGVAAARGDPGRDPRRTGMRNSHLLSIAPTGTISLAFADNASNGIEPAYSWFYTRKKREADGSMREYRVEDHAWRLWRARGENARRCRRRS